MVIPSITRRPFSITLHSVGEHLRSYSARISKGITLNVTETTQSTSEAQRFETATFRNSKEEYLDFLREPIATVTLNSIQGGRISPNLNVRPFNSP